MLYLSKAIAKLPFFIGIKKFLKKNVRKFARMKK